MAHCNDIHMLLHVCENQLLLCFHIQLLFQLHSIANNNDKDSSSYGYRYHRHPFQSEGTRIQTLIKSTARKEDVASVADLANELKSILLSKNKNGDDNTDRIEELIKILSESNVQFNPEECINGPLFAVLHQSGPVPFWEKYDFQNVLKFRNIKGQRYRSILTAADANADVDDDANKNTPSLDVVSYAEFWGQNLSIQACGVCTLLGSSSSTTNTSKNSPQLLSCPVDYKVDVQNASINIFKKPFKLNVQGIGYTRILYADDELRILLAPKDTTDERWMEKAGLTVVQVRCDLVDPNFELL